MFVAAPSCVPATAAPRSKANSSGANGGARAGRPQRANSCAQLNSTQLLPALACIISSASARPAQIPSICPPRHPLSIQPQLRLRSSLVRSTLACLAASTARPRLGLRRYRAFFRPGIHSAPSLSSASALVQTAPLCARLRSGRGSGCMPGRGHLGRVACPLNRDDRRATAALGDGCPTRSNLTARSVEEQLVGRSPEYRRGNPTENPVGKTEVVLQLAGPAGGRQKHSVVVSKTRGSSTVQSLRRLVSSPFHIE